MQNYPGVFIVLEGVDGSGKSTQFELLKTKLKAAGYEVETFKFPRYDEPSSYFVKKYLNGDYGPATQVNPYTASLFYAMDRFETAPQIKQALQAGKVVLSDRYAGANMAHQGSKFNSSAEQRGFFIWADSLEFQLLAIPRPNVNLFLRLPAEVSQQLIEKRNNQRDQHESDLEHLRRTVTTYDSLCQLFPKDFQAVECYVDNQLLSVEQISDLIWQKIQPALPRQAESSAEAQATKAENRPKTAQSRKVSEQPADEKRPEAATTDYKRLSLRALLELGQSANPSLKAALKNVKLASHDFYMPKPLENDLKQKYQDMLIQIAKLKKKISQKLPDGAAAEIVDQYLTPLAAIIEVNISNAQLKQDLKKSRLDELGAGEQSTKTTGGIADKALSELAKKHLPNNISTDLDPLNLLDFWPRNEFELLSDSLYGVSDLPRADIQAEIEGWKYDQKHQALSAILNSSAQGLDSLRYDWDVITDQISLMTLQGLENTKNFKVQTPSPRYGYEVPDIIEKHGLEDDYLSCFDLSLEMYSLFQAQNRDDLAPYTALMGHKVRYQFSTDLPAIIEILSTSRAKLPVGESFKASLIEKINENHPIIANYLTQSLKKPSQKSTSKSRSRRRRARSAKPKD